jgi:hypothetical protein
VYDTGQVILDRVQVDRVFQALCTVIQDEDEGVIRGEHVRV